VQKRTYEEKVLSRQELSRRLEALREEGRTTVFTNGCFDLLHPGHIRYLTRAAELGDVLVVALNSDDSVRRVKGRDRPVLGELDRAEVLAALECVDFVTVFREKTPLETIEAVRPDILVKGGDWPVDQIVGKDIVEEYGGKVLAIEFEEGYSTTRIIDRIRSSEGSSGISG
jgi:rfaE bifunctional protein nucleotidyltransferase chain/domain